MLQNKYLSTMQRLLKIYEKYVNSSRSLLKSFKKKLNIKNEKNVKA